MRWFEDNDTKRRLSQVAARQSWAQSEAMVHFEKLRGSLPEELRHRSRIGPLSFSEMPGAEGELGCWLYPVDGSKLEGLLLGPKNEVKFVDKAGNVYYEGLWGDTSLDLIEQQEKFYIWLKAPERKKTLVFKIEGVNPGPTSMNKGRWGGWLRRLLRIK